MEKTKMDVENMLRDFCNAVEQHDGQRLAQLFSEDGVYHDVFYGAYAGRERVAELIDVWFYKDADDVRWDMVDVVSRVSHETADVGVWLRETILQASRVRAECSSGMHHDSAGEASEMSITADIFKGPFDPGGQPELEGRNKLLLGLFAWNVSC